MRGAANKSVDKSSERVKELPLTALKCFLCNDDKKTILFSPLAFSFCSTRAVSNVAVTYENIRERFAGMTSPANHCGPAESCGQQ